MRYILFALTLSTWTLPGCTQSDPTMNKTTIPLFCDPDTGVCIVPGNDPERSAAGMLSAAPTAKPLTLLYFTDPICSSCWGAEPQLRRLKAEYGHVLDVQYHMGGLLPSWDVYNSGGISKPGDVAGHWDEVSPRYRMPIIGDVWLEDPLPSSHPPSIAFKAAQMQDPVKALALLRRLRELVLVEKRNITRWEVIAQAAKDTGLDVERLKADHAGSATHLFQADLMLARSLGVRGFPTFIFSNAAGERQLVYGARPYAQFTAAVEHLLPGAMPAMLPQNVRALFDLHPSWCAEEAAVMLGIPHAQARAELEAAEKAGTLHAVHTRHGSVWHKR